VKWSRPQALPLVVCDNRSLTSLSLRTLQSARVCDKTTVTHRHITHYPVNVYL